MPHASKPVRYNVAIALSIHQLQFPWVHTQQILRFFALCVQNFNLGFPQMIRYWGPPCIPRCLNTKGLRSNNMPANFVCFCVWHIYIYIMCMVLLPKPGLSLNICFLYLWRIGPTTPRVKIQRNPPAEVMSIAFCMLYLFLAETFPALLGKSAVILYLKRTLSLAPSTHPHPALISRVCISK